LFECPAGDCGRQKNVAGACCSGDREFTHSTRAGYDVLAAGSGVAVSGSGESPEAVVAHERKRALIRQSTSLRTRPGEETVRRPDLAIFVAGRLDGVDRKKIPLPFAADIAVEVLSPSEIAFDASVAKVSIP
jgi:hypothetical protein